MFTRRIARPLRGSGSLQATRRTDEALRLWRGSAFRRHGHGYIGYQWYFLPATPPVLRQIASRGELLVGGNAAVVLYPEEGGRTACVSVLAGKRAALTAVRRAAGERGYTAVEAFFPRDPRIVRWAGRAGFKSGSWGTRAVLYERRV